MSPPVEIRREELTSATAQGLIRALNAELAARYPEEGATYFRLDPEEVAEGRGAFLVAWSDERPAACGAIRSLDPETGEIKRMYVEPSARGQDLGRAVLSALEAEARRLGLVRLVLETGARQHTALALYQRAGFARIPPFGDYAKSPLSICLEKELSG